MFKDIVRIKVIAGKGGNGCVSFRREKYVPKGGPDGGDGGKGGDCIIVVNPHLSTLSHITDGQVFKAQNGEDGKGKKMHGADGKDVIIEVPKGTIVIDAETNKVICDTAQVDRFVVARGGKGGLGNWHFRSPTNQAPTYATKGEPGEVKELILDLRIIADVGLVGFPNVGKSSIISKLTRATPKIADYPFTTKEPVLGVIGYKDKRIIIADIPGIIENASKGAGLGLEFLKHIERTKFLILVLEIVNNPINQAKILLKELNKYNKELLKRIRIVVFNKIDLLSSEEEINKEELEKELAKLIKPKPKFFYVSALLGINIDELKEGIIEIMEQGN